MAFAEVEYYKQGLKDGASRQPQGDREKSKEESSHRKFQLMQLCAYAGVACPDELPEIWMELLTLKPEQYEYARLLITRAIIKTALESGIEISKFYLDEQVVKDIMKVILSQGPDADFDNIETGMSIVAFMKRTTGEIRGMRVDEIAREESKGTRTEGQSKQNQKKKPRTPPATLDSTLKLLATYGMSLKSLFSNKCSHFQEVMRLRSILASLEGKEEYLTGDTFAVIVWTVIEDACQFFATTVCEDDFGQNGLDEEARPESDLRETSRNLRKLLPVKPANFPWQWEGNKTGAHDSSRGR